MPAAAISTLLKQQGIVTDAVFWQQLEHLSYCSPFAELQLQRHPEWMLPIISKQAGPTLQQLQQHHSLDTALRHYRNRRLVEIIWSDLNQQQDLQWVCSELSALAEHCLQAATEAHQSALTETYGYPRQADGAKAEFVIIAMGKLGGMELNLSSDIDLVFSFSAPGDSDGPRSISNEAYFKRLAQKVIQSLDQVSDEGFVFRVDTRLRPFGDAGPLVSSFTAMEHYYQSEGRDWERYAWVKARPVAGDLDAGRELLNRLKPFVYRRYVDFGALDALRQMHQQVSHEVTRKNYQQDIKRGPGGIRQIEFIVQTFQLLRGGRDPSLQTGAFFSALQACRKLQLLSPNQIDTLDNSYTYLRTLENRLQAQHDHQVHRLPKAIPDRQRLVAAMGSRDWAELTRALQQHRNEVESLFTTLFSHQHADQDPWQQVWTLYLENNPGPPTESFGSSEKTHQHLIGFSREIKRKSLSPTASRRLNRFMPQLLRHISKQPAAENRLPALLDLTASIARRSAYLSLMLEQPLALDRVVDLFSRSSWLAEKITRYPALLDELIDPLLGESLPTTSDLASQVQKCVEEQDIESALNQLNYLRISQALRIAVALLNGRMQADAVQQELSSLAQCLLQGVLRLAQADCKNDLSDSQVAVIAYGSLGAHEMNFTSDLDLVFLYTENTGQGQETAVTRLAQKTLALLTSLTPNGRLYEVDSRLRPNGRAGLLVSNFDAFKQYQHETAWLWETQALTRARWVAGAEPLKAQFTRLRQQVISKQRSASQVRRTVREMRDKLQEQGKQKSANHLLDISFIAQSGILSHAAENIDAASIPQNTLQQLHWLCVHDHLSEAFFSRLQQAYLDCISSRQHKALTGQNTGLGSADQDIAEYWQQLMLGDT